MPNVYVLKEDLFRFIGKEFTDDQFEDLCFAFGLEVERGTGEEMNIQKIDGEGNPIDVKSKTVFKLEVAANRYDLLCLEGFTQAIRAYLGMAPIPRLSIKNQRPGGLEKIIVKPETQEVRPYVVAAILRNIKFDV